MRVRDNAAGTITVLLQSNFTSPTGYATVTGATNGSWNSSNSGSSTPGASSYGYNGTFPIMSGNGTSTLVLSDPGVTTGAAVGSMVSDAQVHYATVNGYPQATFTWSTPGSPSTTNVSFGNSFGDSDSFYNGTGGNIFRSQVQNPAMFARDGRRRTRGRGALVD